MLQQIFGDVPAAIDGADHIGLGHPDVVEEGLAERRLAGDQEDRLGRDPLRGHVEQDEADAVVLLAGRVGAHQAENPVGEIGVGGPDLLAVDDEIVAVALGPGLQRGEIGSGVRLGIALAPADQPGGDLRQMLLLLRLGAVFQAAPVPASRCQRKPAAAARRSPPFPGARSWFLRHRGRRRHIPLGQCGTVQPLSRIRSNQSRCGSEANDGVASAPERIFVRRHRPPHLVRTIGFQPGAGFTAEIDRDRT